MKIIPLQIKARFTATVSANEGYRIDEGWEDLAYKLDEELNRINPDYQLNSIENVDGQMWAYGIFGNKTQQIEAKLIISDYSERSLEICEICGKPGETTALGSTKVVRCDNHNKFLSYDTLI